MSIVKEACTGSYAILVKKNYNIPDTPAIERNVLVRRVLLNI
jgi:hypothetical protein